MNDKIKPVSLKISGYYEQIGIDTLKIKFTWKLISDFRNQVQTAYQLIIYENESEIFYDSEKKISEEQSISVDLRGILKSNKKYFWKVCVWDNEDKSFWSDNTSFVTGYLGISDWKASWIGNNTEKPFYARKSFQVKKEIKNAFAYVCGLGQFKLFLNGEKVSNHEMDPGWTNYHKSVQYVTFDISGILKAGENVIGVSIGNGFYKGDSGERHFYVIGKGYEPFGNPTLICELHIEYGDGSTDIILSDETWTTRASATTLANVYGSENFDGRIYPHGFNNIRFNDKNWSKSKIMFPPKGTLTSQKQPPIVTKKVYDTVRITEPKTQIYVFDIGQNMSGIFEIFVSGRAGEVVTIKPGETLKDDGTIATPWDIETFSQYTLRGTGEIENWKPDFSCAGARWVQIEGATRDKENASLPFIHDVKGHFVTSAAEDVGEFKTGDERINKLHYIIVKAIESNLQSVHSDCPTIEKLGWLETAHLMGPSVMYNKGVKELWEKIVKDMVEAQTEDGLIPDIAPEYSKFPEGFRDSPAWGSSIIIAPWILYQYYDDTEAAEYAYEAMKKYMNYLKIKEYDDGLLKHGLGDWGIGPNLGESRENVETAIYYWDLCIISEFSRLFGKYEEERYFKVEAERIKENYNEKMLVLNPLNNKYCYRAYDEIEKIKITQANQAFPLYLEMVPKDKLEQVIDNFMETVSSHKIASGEIGLRFIIQTLLKYGRNDIVYDMMLQPEHPSYIRFVDKKETTLPEFWTDVARSRNHDMMGHILEWMHQSIGGISSLDPGYKKIKIAPYVPKSLKWASCSYESVKGKITCNWEIDNKNFKLNVLIPVNSTAKVYIPMMGFENVVLSENKNVIYGNNNFGSKKDNISFMGLENNRNGDKSIVLGIKSGDYNFELTGN